MGWRVFSTEKMKTQGYEIFSNMRLSHEGRVRLHFDCKEQNTMSYREVDVSQL